MLIIALSGYAPTSNPEKVSAAGFDEYLVKPVKIGELQKLLENIPSVLSLLIATNGLSEHAKFLGTHQLSFSTSNCF